MDPLAIPVPAPPPWPPDYFDTPEVCLEVGLDVTKRDNPALLKATFLEWVSRRYQGQSLVFTDGSLNGRSGGERGCLFPTSTSGGRMALAAAPPLRRSSRPF